MGLVVSGRWQVSCCSLLLVPCLPAQWQCFPCPAGFKGLLAVLEQIRSRLQQCLLKLHSLPVQAASNGAQDPQRGCTGGTVLLAVRRSRSFVSSNKGLQFSSALASCCILYCCMLTWPSFPLFLAFLGLYHVFMTCRLAFGAIYAGWPLQPSRQGWTSLPYHLENVCCVLLCKVC